MEGEDQEPVRERAYGCSYGCGNPYDMIVVSIADSTTEFLCMPCFVKLATDIITAMTDPENEAVQKMLAAAGEVMTAPMKGGGVKPRGRNAPAGTEDQDLIDAFDSVVTVEELGPEFR